MRRVLGLMMVAGLLLGAAACGSSSGGSKASDTTATTAADGGSGSGSGSGGGTSSNNAAVQAYCKAVDAYVKKVKAAVGDATKMGTLSQDSQDLAKKAQALGTSGLSADDATAVAACTKKSTDALTGG